MASPSFQLNARQLVTLYTRRMRIELSFRDFKSYRYGQTFEDSLIRRGSYIEVLPLLVSARPLSRHGRRVWHAKQAESLDG
ncbi:MAG: hypothetical protein EPN74_05335 [Rhodanobacter sp.]|nr:MAG: hypothetical protein EPN74_05335 [Rhodanobacter sp.]